MSDIAQAPVIGDFFPPRYGFEYVCECCPCGETILFAVDDYLIAECPHVVMQLEAGRVVGIHSLGTRQ